MKKFFPVILLFLSTVTVRAQEAPPFWNEISAFKASDKATPPPQHAILFVGSSSFRMWHNVQAAFSGYQIINRGFGGSQLTDVMRYFYDIILPYQPRQIVIYCGENDLVEKGVTAKDVFVRFQTLFCMIRKNLPDAMIDFVSIKPSPSRIAVRDQVIAANQMIKNFITSQSKARYIDIYLKMLDADGNVMNEIFKDDFLHLNEMGYAIWQKAILPYLLK